MTYAGRVILALCLAACQQQQETVSIAPTLHCKDKVVCHIIAWDVGSKYALAVSGTHVSCKCEGD